MKKSICIMICILMVVLSLAACNSGVTITVNFIVDGVEYNTATTKEGVSPKLPSDPTKEGYTFDAWYYDDGVWEKPMTAQSFLDLPITENMMVTVYAHFNENEPQPQGMDFNTAVTAYNTRTAFYIAFSATINGTTVDGFEWYEDSEKLIIKTTAVIGEPPIIWYHDKTSNKSYSVDKAQQKMIQGNVGITNLVPPVSGNGTDGTIVFDSKTYPCKNYIVDSDVNVKFVNDRNTLLAIVFVNDAETQSRIYTNITISSTIPTTSDLYGVTEYEKSNWIAKTIASDSMSPTLTMGTTYYFEPVDAASLQVGDIILVNATIGGQETTVAHRIVSIQENGGVKTFSLKGDNNPFADVEQYTEDDIIGKIVGSYGSSGETGGGGNEPEPEDATVEAKRNAIQEIETYAASKKNGLMADYQLSIDNEMVNASLLINAAGELNGIEKALLRGKYKIDIEVLENNYLADCSAINVECNERINYYQSIAQGLIGDLYEGSESEYNQAISALNTEGQQASIDYDKQIKAAKMQYGTPLPASIELQIQTTYNNKVNSIANRRSEINRLWTNRLAYEEAIGQAAIWENTKTSRLAERNDEFSVAKQEIVTKINLL